MRNSRAIMVLLAIWIAQVTIPASAAAQWDRRLVISAEPELVQSTVVDNVPRIVSLYILDTGSTHATGVTFSTEPGPGFTGVWLGDASAYLFAGNSQTSISIAYASCHPLPVLALTITYQLFGTSSACSELRIAPPAGYPCVISPDTGCAFVEHCINSLGHLQVNCPVATTPSTWGKVKALYR